MKKRNVELVALPPEPHWVGNGFRVHNFIPGSYHLEMERMTPYKGKVEHHDSHGGGGIIGEGDVQWMTAASGVLHKEYHEKAWNCNI